MTILVTGGAGFIGSNFIFYMMDRYPEYRIVWSGLSDIRGESGYTGSGHGKSEFSIC